MVGECDPLWLEMQLPVSRKIDGSATSEISSLIRQTPDAVKVYETLAGVLFHEIGRSRAAFLSEAVVTLLTNPLALVCVGSRLDRPVLDVYSAMEMGADGHFRSLDAIVTAFANQSRQWLGREIHSGTIARSVDGLIPDMAAVQDPIEILIIRLEKASQYIQGALRLLTTADQRALFCALPGWEHLLIERNGVDSDAAVLVNLAEKIDRASLQTALLTLAPLLTPDFLDALASLDRNRQLVPLRSQPAGIEGDVLLVRSTPVGTVVVGGRGPNVYDIEAAVIIDLGGDDIYLNHAGGTGFSVQNGIIQKITQPIGMVIDCAGNDRYLSQRLASVGAGILGMGILVDLLGDDLYSGNRLTIGAALFGIGVLMDLDGNDTYVSQAIGQGAAIFGDALLLDFDGDDVYAGAKFVQGFGGPGGFGYLLDAAGCDRYTAGKRFPSGYGTRDIYEAWSQGMAQGWRGMAGGGIGMIRDLSGNDVYEAGNFSQGTGYYFGVGVLRDDKGHDMYRGSRYCQGTAAHQAAGMLLDRDGNDHYVGRVAASMGAGWDVAVAGFFDYTGNDRYTAADFSLGAGAQNGIGIFFDGSGMDVYQLTGIGLGAGGQLTYQSGRGARNLGLFLDRGGKPDRYHTVFPRHNGRRITRIDEAGIFADE